jgi:hypothetical protein
MPIFNLTSEDTVVIFDRVFNDLADGDAVTVAYTSDKVATTTGKNGNTIFAKNEKGKNANVTMRVMRGSSDDQFLSGKMSLSDKDFAATVLAEGSFVKRLGDGLGATRNDVYTLNGGTFMREIDGKENVAGDTEQGVAVYNLMFARIVRSIQ